MTIEPDGRAGAPLPAVLPPNKGDAHRVTRPTGDVSFYAQRHLRVGWWSMLIFLTLGVVLETLHGFKVGWYLNVSNDTRRLMWTLAHAHGTLLGVIHVAFAATVALLAGWSPRARSLASVCLMAASVLLPGGFFLGGIFVHAGDPGLGILLVPLGAVALFVAVFLTARGATDRKARPASPDRTTARPKSTGKEHSGG